MEREISNLQKEQLKITIEQLSNSIEQLRNNLENMEGSDNSQVVKTLKANITYQKQILMLLVLTFKSKKH